MENEKKERREGRIKDEERRRKGAVVEVVPPRSHRSTFGKKEGKSVNKATPLEKNNNNNSNKGIP